MNEPVAVIKVKSPKMNEVIGVLANTLFRTEHAPQSTRQLTYYQEKGVMLTNRNEGDGWREFNANELIWLNIIAYLRLFGYPMEKIKDLRDNYIAKREQGVLIKGEYKTRFFEMPVAMSIISKSELFFIITLDGDVTFYDDISYKQWKDKNSYMRHPHISIPLGEMIRDLWNNIPDEEKIEFDLPEFEYLSAAEKKIIKEVREGKYLTISIVFKGRQPILLRKFEQADTRQRLIDILNKHNYVNMKVVKKDGKIIHIENELTEKL